MAAGIHTLLKNLDGVNWTPLTTEQARAANVGIVHRSDNSSQGELIMIANNNTGAGDIQSFVVGCGSNTGVIKISTGNAAEGDCITISDGAHTLDIYEFDVGVQSTGTVELLAAPNLVQDGDTITISDGSTALTFEFDDGVIGDDGIITFNGNAAHGDTVEAWSNTYYFTEGIRATGSLSFLCQPADGQTVTLRDGTHTVVFEFDDTAEKAVGNITLAAGNAQAGDIITIDDGTHAAIGFECNGVGAYAFALGASNLATLVNLYTQILAAHTAGDLDIVPTNDGAGTISLLHDLYGVVGNQAIVETVDAGGTWGHAGMAGGVDAIVLGTNVPISIRGTTELSAYETYVEINYQHGLTNLDITPVNSAPTVVSLTNDTPGVAGNTAIDTTSHAIVEANMTGGIAAGAAGSYPVGNVPVVIGALAADSCDNLYTAVTTYVPQLLLSTTHAAGVLNFIWEDADSSYNFGNLAVSSAPARIVLTHDCTNGATPGTAITPGNVGVAIAATNVLTAVNLRTQINAAPINLLCSAITVPGTVPVYNINYGANNVAMVDSTAGARMTATGMANGVNPTGAVTAGHIAVAKGSTASDSATNLMTAINASAVGNYVAGTPYTDPVTPTTYCVPITGDSTTDRILLDTFRPAGTITLAAGNATAGDTITVSDGVHTASTFIAGGDGIYSFAIGVTNLGTIANLLTAMRRVKNEGLFDISAANATSSNIITLFNDRYGSAGNVSIVKTETGAVWTVSGMSGGNNIVVEEGTDEYLTNEIGVQEVRLSNLGSASFYRPITTLAQKTVIAGTPGVTGTGIFYVTKGNKGNSIPGVISANIIAIPHLVTATTVLGDFYVAGGENLVLATGVIRNH